MGSEMKKKFLYGTGPWPISLNIKYENNEIGILTIDYKPADELESEREEGNIADINWHFISNLIFEIPDFKEKAEFELWLKLKHWKEIQKYHKKPCSLLA
jgi:hypothetical protein